VMVVSSAVRDEGTSFHYAPPSRTLKKQTPRLSQLSRTA
jgi:hypothetical protein